MAVRIVVGGQAFNIKGTDDPEVARKLAKRELRRRSGDYSALGETFLKGPLYGLQTGLIQGPVELATTIFDLVHKTDYTSDVQDFFTKHKVEKPLTTAGSVSSALFQFGAPASMATKMARKSLLKPKKRGKLFQKKEKFVEKPKFFKHTVAPIAMADFVAATAETPEFGVYKFLDPDFFAPTNSESEVKLLDEKITAGDRLAKRLRVGAEGATLLLGLPALWKTLKATGSGVASELGSTTPAITAAKWMQNKKANIKSMLDEAQYKTKKWKVLGKEFDPYNVAAKFRSQGALPASEVSDARAAKTAAINEQVTFLESNLANLWGGFKFLNKSNMMSADELVSVADNMRLATYGSDMPNLTKAKQATIRKKALKNLAEVDKKYMTKKNWFKTITEEVDPKTKELLWKEEIAPKFSFVKNAELSRNQIDDLSKVFLKEEETFKKFLSPGFLEAVDANLGKYGYQAYRAFIDNVDHVVKKNSPQWKRAREEMLSGKIAKTPDDADQILRDLLGKRNFDNAFMTPEMALDGVKMGLLKDKTLQNFPEIRKFLGEITAKTGTAEQRVLDLMMKTRASVENLAKMTSSMRYLDEVAQINQRFAEAGSTQRFLYNTIDEVPEARRAAFLDEYDVPITIPAKPMFGPLSGKVTTKRIADSLIGAQTGWLESTKGLTSRTWATFLGAKGLVQQFKTIYSPITQVRNATSAALFAVMNGNIANGKTLQDSTMIVFDMLRKAQGTDRAAYYANAQRKNVVQTGARAAEIEGIMDDAVKTLKIKENSPFGKAAKIAQNNFFSRLYMGSDDVWKIVSWEMEKGKLARAFENASARSGDFVIPPSYYKYISPKTARELGKAKKGGVWANLDAKIKNEVIEDIGAAIVRDTVPNYSKVPSIIRSLRRTPFGNFIAFPAETIRTAVNSTSRAIDEIASGVPELAEVGMRRLMGNMAVMYAIPKSTYEFGKWMTGADDEQVQAYKRSFAAPWEKNADLVPIRTDKDGNIVEFYNYTYSNPYEYLRTPIASILNAVANGEERGDKLHEKFWDGLVGSEQTPGFLREFLEPFLGESIVTTGVLDTWRNVTYQSGSAQSIYNETDGMGEKVSKSFAHMFNMFAPPVIPFKVKPGQPGDLGPLFWRDLPRSTLYSLGISEKPLSKKGIKPNIYDQMAQSFTGLKTIKPTIERTLGFRALDAKDQMRQAVSYYSAAASNPNILNPEEHVRALMKTNEAQFNAIKDLSMAIEDAKALGADENEIYKILKDKKISKPEYIMNRTFIPYYPSAFQIERVLEKGALFPEQELRKSFVEQIKPTLPTTSFQGGPFVPPVPAKRLTAQQKATQDPRGSAATLLRQRELEKLLGIN